MRHFIKSFTLNSKFSPLDHNVLRCIFNLTTKNWSNFTKIINEKFKWKPWFLSLMQSLCFKATLLLLLLLLSLQSCLTLCDPIDGSPPGSPVPGILQARSLEQVAISFSNARKWKVKVKSLSRVQILAIPWTAAHQAPLSKGFLRQEYWSGVPLPSPLKLHCLCYIRFSKILSSSLTLIYFVCYFFTPAEYH